VMGTAFAVKLDSAWPYITPGFASRDSSPRFAAAYIAYTGGSKLVQASAFERAFAWLEPSYARLAGDTIGPRRQLAALTSLYYGLASTYSVGPMLQALGASKKCDLGPAVSDRLQRAKRALVFGGSVAPAAIVQPMQIITRFDNYVQQVRRAYHCRNF